MAHGNLFDGEHNRVLSRHHRPFVSSITPAWVSIAIAAAWGVTGALCVLTLSLKGF